MIAGLVFGAVLSVIPAIIHTMWSGRWRSIKYDLTGGLSVLFLAAAIAGILWGIGRLDFLPVLCAFAVWWLLIYPFTNSEIDWLYAKAKWLYH